MVEEQKISYNSPGHRQRLRDRFLANEPNAHEETALLELLLTYAIPQRDVRPLAQKLLTIFGSLSNVLTADMHALCTVDGIKEHTAALLKLCDWIRIHYVATQVMPEQSKLSNNEDQTTHSSASRPPLQAGFLDNGTLAMVTDEPVSLATENRLANSNGQGTETSLTSEQPEVRADLDNRRRVIRRYGTELVIKAVLREAIDILPRLPDTESLDEISAFLKANLHFSAEQTRERYTNYIIRRMFPDGYADQALRSFAVAYAGRQELRDVAFYRFCKAEPLMIRLINDLLVPAISSGSITREMLRAYLAQHFPESKSIKDSAQAIIEAMVAGGIVKADRARINFAYREVLLPSFAFVVHSEFAEPGMYSLAELESNTVFRAMFWKPDHILPSLYELRNQGFIAKISEIDNVRQFTVRTYLDELVLRLTNR